MKHTVKLTKVTKEQVEVEVEFPIYREHDVGGDDYDSIIYTRIDEDREISIHKRDRYGGRKETEWQIEVEHGLNLSGEVDYALGRGEYKSNADAFNKALQELRDAVAKLG